MTFWSDYSITDDGKGFEPKRKHTFLLSIVGKNNSLDNFLIKKVKKPGFEISESEHKYLNHTFYYPGKVKWKEVTFTVVDVISPNSSQTFMKILEECGYKSPVKSAENLVAGTDNQTVGLESGNSQTISKLRSVQALGIPIIRQIDANGETVDSWRLMGAWIKDVEFGELNYDEEDLMAIDVTLRYDYAYNTITQPEKAVFPSNNPKED